MVGLDKGFANLNAVVAVTSDSDRYTLLVFDRLFAFDKIGNLQPSQATSVEISPDGLAYTYRLREGVKFHNGSALKADDVKLTMAFLLDPLTKGSRRAFFAPYVEGVDVLDPLTVRFRLKSPDGAFKNKLAGYLPIITGNYGSTTLSVNKCVSPIQCLSVPKECLTICKRLAKTSASKGREVAAPEQALALATSSSSF